MSGYALSGPALVILGVLAVLGLLSARQSARRVVARARGVARTGNVLLRVIGTGAGITVAQWVLLRATSAPWVWAVALGAPALLAGSAIHPMFTVTTITHTRLTGRGRSRR